MQHHKKIDGVKISKAMLQSIGIEVKALISSGWHQPSLTSISFGQDEAIARYVRNQKKAAEVCGIRFVEKHLSKDVSKKEMIEIINSINCDPVTSGVIIQRPVPSHLSVREIQESIHPLKDVEGMHTSNIGHVLYGNAELAPCTAKAAISCLKSTSLGNRGNNLKGLECVVVGHSEIVGKPISYLLMNEGATVTTCHHMTIDLKSHTRMADCVIVAVGKIGLITGDMLKPGAVLIDVGINPSPSGVGIVGDADFNSCLDVAGWITPVPGGVGQVTTAHLMQNVVSAAKQQKKLYLATYSNAKNNNNAAA